MASGRAIEAGRAFLKLFVEDDGFKRGLLGTARYLDSWGKSFRSAGLRLAIAGEAILAPFQLATVAFVRAGSNLQDMADRTGVSVEALGELKYALEQTGGQLEDAERAVVSFSKFLKQVEAGGDGAKQVVSALGLSFKDLQGQAPDKQLRAVLSALGQIEDPLKRISLVTAILGKGGTALIPLIKQFDALSNEARELGLVMSSKDAAAADRLGDAFGTLQAAVRSVAHAVAAQLEPKLTEILGSAIKVVVTFRDWAKANEGLVLSVAALGVALVGAGVALSTIGATFDGIQLVLLGLSAITSPVALVVAAIGVAAAAFYGFGNVIDGVVTFASDRFAGLSNFVRGVIKNMAASLSGGDIVGAANVLWAALKVSWLQGAGELQKIWRDLGFKMLDTLVEIGSAIQNIWTNVVASIKAVIPSIVTEIQTVIDFLDTVESSIGKSPKDKLYALAGFAGRQGEREKSRDSATDEINSERDARLRAIAATLRASKASIAEGKQTQIAAAKAALDQAQRDLQLAKIQAAETVLAGGLEPVQQAAFSLNTGMFGAAKESRARFGGKGAEQFFGGATNDIGRRQLSRLESIDRRLGRMGGRMMIGNN